MADRFWVGGTSTWNATAGSKWALTSGGAGGEAVPTASDDVYFDASSGAGTITISGARTCLNLDCTGFTGDIAGTGGLTISASMTFSGTMASSHSGTYTFNATSGTNTITTAGNSLTNSFTFNGVGGTWELSDPLETTGTITLTNGTFNLNGFDTVCSIFSSSNSNTRTFDISNSFLTITGASTTVWNTATTTNFTFTSSGSLVETTGSSIIISPNTIAFEELNFRGTNPTVTVISRLTSSSTEINGTGTLVLDGGFTFLADSFTPNSSTVSCTNAGTTAINKNVTFYNFTVAKNGGTVNTNTGFTVQNTFFVANGAFDANDQNISLGKFNSATDTFARSIAMGSGTWTITGTGTIWDITTHVNLTITQETSTINITDSSATAKTFAGAGEAYNNITFSGDNITVSGANTFATMAVNNAGLTNGLKLTHSVTQTVTGFTTNGSVGNLCKIVSTSSGTAATLSKTTGTVNASYMSLQDSAADGGATWNALNSTNVSGNTGWVFSDPPASSASRNGRMGLLMGAY